jgi:hypothetical protein
MTMKKHLILFTLVLIAMAPARASAEPGVEADPAFLPIDRMIDLKTIRPEVNVNLPRFLLKDAVSELNGGTNDPFAATGVNLAELIKEVKLIRVVVLDVGPTNLAAVASGVAGLRNHLESKWSSIASVPEENVGIYAIGDPSGESIAGLAVLIQDGGDVVIVNVVGRVSLSKLVRLAAKFDKIPKDLLKMFSGVLSEDSEKPTPPKEKDAP